MSGHTPGPWRICLGLICADTPKGQAELASVYKESEYVAPLPHIANARLIAAAPEMLGALKETMRELRRLRGNSPAEWDNLVDVGLCNAWDRCKSAIAKAEGK